MPHGVLVSRVLLPAVGKPEFLSALDILEPKSGKGVTKPPSHYPGPDEPPRFVTADQLPRPCVKRFMDMGCRSDAHHWFEKSVSASGKVFRPGSYKKPIGACKCHACEACAPVLLKERLYGVWDCHFGLQPFLGVDHIHFTFTIPEQFNNATCRQLAKLRSLGLRVAEELLRQAAGLPSRGKKSHKRRKAKRMGLEGPQVFITEFLHPEGDERKGLAPHPNVWAPALAWLPADQARPAPQTWVCPNCSKARHRRYELPGPGQSCGSCSRAAQPTEIHRGEIERRMVRFSGFNQGEVIKRGWVLWKAAVEEVFGPFDGKAIWDWTCHPSRDGTIGEPNDKLQESKWWALKEELHTFPGVLMPKNLSKVRYAGGWAPRIWGEVRDEMGVPEPAPPKKCICKVGEGGRRGEHMCGQPFTTAYAGTRKLQEDLLLLEEHLGELLEPETRQALQAKSKARTYDNTELGMKRCRQGLAHELQFCISLLAGWRAIVEAGADDSRQGFEALVRAAEQHVLPVAQMALVWRAFTVKEIHQLKDRLKVFIRIAERFGMAGDRRVSPSLRRQLLGAKATGQTFSHFDDRWELFSTLNSLLDDRPLPWWTDEGRVLPDIDFVFGTGQGAEIVPMSVRVGAL